MHHHSLSQSRRQLLRDRAHYMRHHPTYSEALLFSALRGRRLGVSFRPQQVIGNHIVDFLARKVRLVVEVYKKSSRRYPCPLNEPVYGPNYEVRKVLSGGEINWKGAKVFISESLKAQQVGIRWHEPERLWLLEFGDLLAGRLNQDGRFKRSDTTKEPGALVSPMLPVHFVTHARALQHE